MWKGVVNKSFDTVSFDEYLHTLSWSKWRPSFIVLHNTAVPSLAQRPKGFTEQNIRDLEVFYRDKQKWSGSPHLFIDDNKIIVFNPLTMSGTHSPSWNKLSIGIEMLGDYSTDPFDQGRGLDVRKNTVAAIASLSAVLGIDPETIQR